MGTVVTDVPEWLPGLIRFEDYDGNWHRYVEAVYAWFEADFLHKEVYYQGNKLALKRHPEFQGKSATFWHIVSEGSVEEERLPDLRRCERIRWPCPVIEHSADTVCKVWEQNINGERRIHIWLEAVDFIVVVAVRRGYYLLWTAFPILENHQRRKFQKRYEAYKKADAAP